MHSATSAQGDTITADGPPQRGRGRGRCRGKGRGGDVVREACGGLGGGFGRGRGAGRGRPSLDSPPLMHANTQISAETSAALIQGRDQTWDLSKVEKHAWTSTDILHMEQLKEAAEKCTHMGRFDMLDFKTRFCSYEEKRPGSCKYTPCFFAHDLLELRYFRASKWCGTSPGQVCPGRSCPFQHKGEKTPMEEVNASRNEQKDLMRNMYGTKGQHDIASEIAMHEMSQSQRLTGGSSLRTKARHAGGDDGPHRSERQNRDVKLYKKRSTEDCEEQPWDLDIDCDEPIRHKVVEGRIFLSRTEFYSENLELASPRKRARLDYNEKAFERIPSRDRNVMGHDSPQQRGEKRLTQQGGHDRSLVTETAADCQNTFQRTRESDYEDWIDESANVELQKLGTRKAPTVTCNLCELTFASTQLLIDHCHGGSHKRLLEKAQRGRPRAASGSPADNSIWLGASGSEEFRVDYRSIQGTDIEQSTHFPSPGNRKEARNSLSSTPTSDKVSEMKSSSCISTPGGISGGRENPVPEVDAGCGKLENVWGQGHSSRLGTKEIRNEGATKGVAEERSYRVSELDQPVSPSTSRRHFNSSVDGNSTESYRGLSIADSQGAEPMEKIVMSTALLDQKMTFDIWKKLERRFLTKGGIQGLAFKIIRDLLLSPNVSVSKADMESMNAIIARVPLNARQSGCFVNSDDFPYCGLFPHGKQGVYNQKECSALGRVSLSLLNCIDPFHHSVQMSSEPALGDPEIQTESEATAEAALTDLSMNPTFGTVRGSSLGIRRRQEQVLSGGPSSPNAFRVVEELGEVSNIALHPRSVLRDPVYLSLRQRTFRDAVVAKARALHGDEEARR